MSMKEKYGLTDEGVRNVRVGAVWTAVSNLTIFGGVGGCCLLVRDLMNHMVGGAPLPSPVPYLLGMAAFLI